jgi:predicted N-formylglutamate amidohydrolase
MKIGALLLTCEHGGNRVPREYAYLFAGAKARRALAGHPGCDLGALPLARALARDLDAGLVYWTTTRLLVEPNRSPGHPGLFSEFSRRLDPAARKAVLERYYAPHRERVLAAVESRCANVGLVCHVGVHSFTPVLGGRRRTADIGLLYDPARRYEAAVCAVWQRALLRCDPTLHVRRNYPYRGDADGLTTALRRRFPADRYIGIELETNQVLLAGAGPPRRRVTQAITASLKEVLQTSF